MFNKNFVAVALAASAVLAAGAPAFAGDQDFTIVNKTGVTFKKIYVEASSNEDTWGDNVLEDDDVLKTGETFDVEFAGYGKECKFDMMFVDAKGTKWTIEDVDLCETEKFVLTKTGNTLHWKAL